VPKNIFEVGIKYLHVKNTCLAVYIKELKVQIFSAKTFSFEDPQDGETCNPVLETNKTKYMSDVSINKLNVKIVVHEDLQ
jgi:hypothetical protein